MMVYVYSPFTVRLAPYSKDVLLESPSRWCADRHGGTIPPYWPPWHHSEVRLGRAVARYGLEFGWPRE